MRASKPANHQLGLGPLPLNNVVGSEAAYKKVVSTDISSANAAAGALIDQARERSGLTRKEVCALMLIDEPRYSKWVAGAANDSVSFARLLLLPPTFWFHLNQLLNERFGLRRMIAAQLLGVAADLALAGER